MMWHFGIVPALFRLLLGGGLGFTMMLMWILPVVLVVWFASSAATRRTSLTGYGPAQPVGQDPAVQIVRERFARGEIGREEYERLMAELLGRC
jgi:putative membrane protein